MDKELWKTVNDIFHATLDLPPEKRRDFLDSAATDPQLRAEVESLLRADGAAGSYLETPVFAGDAFRSTPPLAPGDLLCARFRIERSIAEGGMGHVFEAFDQELSVRVALKVIRPEIAENAEALARFRQEVRLARQITHPNVARTFDINREVRSHDGREQLLVFLTMEFLEGETLAALLHREGRLELSRAFDIASQVAEALAAAHRLGIIHRDIKPANIILVPGTSASPDRHLSGTSNRHFTGTSGVRAVVTDFGLARLNTLLPGEHSTISLSGNPIGTLAYMAPEQLAGEPVSPATDVYAFGLVVFEMLTGTRAFPSEALLSGLAQRLTGTPPALKKLVPDVPANWDEAVAHCLLRDPAARFQNPQDAMLQIEGKLPVRRLRQQVAITLPRKRWLLLAISVLIVAASLLAFRFIQYGKPAAVPAGALVYLTPIENHTGDDSLNNLGELLTGSLAQSAHIRLLDPARAEDILRQMGRVSTSSRAPMPTRPDATAFREVAMRAGATRVLLASLSRKGDAVQLNIDLQQPDQDPAHYRNHWTQEFSWQSSSASSTTLPPQALAAFRSASEWVRHTVGESANDIAQLDAPPEDVTTSNWQALSDYSAARKLLFHVDIEHKEQAIALLRDAVRRDPGFARAWADLGDNLVSLDQRKEGYQAYLTALNGEGGRRLSRKERDFIQGSFATDTRDYQMALEAFRDLSAFYPNDFDAWYYQAFPLSMLDRPDDAIKALNRATPLLTPPEITVGQLSYNTMLQGNLPAAQHFSSLVRKAGREGEANELDGIIAFLDGRYDDADHLFQHDQQTADYGYRWVGYLMDIRLLAEQGRMPAALNTASSGIDALGSATNNDQRGLQFLDRAAVEMSAGMYGNGITDLEEAFRRNSTPDAILVGSELIGRFLPHLNPLDRRRAIALLHTMEQSISAGPAVSDAVVVDALAHARVRGEIYLAEGHIREALDNFRKADALDAPLAPRDSLARALIATAAAEPDPARARTLREEALNAYGRTALRPVTVWRIAWQYAPGEVASQMTAYLSLARTLGHTDDDTARVITALEKMQAHASPVPAPSTRAGTANVPATIH